MVQTKQKIFLFQKTKKLNDSNFFVSFDYFNTGGISQMSHNDENDSYKNNSLVAKYETFLNDKLKIRN